MRRDEAKSTAMSYQVLARKWRPGKFGELVGQEHVVSAISNALDNDRLHHAYLFTGTRGVGKTTIARIFSKSLNCEEGQGANPCGQCDTCKEIEHGNYVDLLEIDAASRTKVEDTRELLDNVQYKPTRGRYKVYLIDEVHMLSKHSFNALLKTLEEPPPHVKFLLATTDPQKLPITILSRCLQFNLKAMSREQIVGQLSHILEQESLSFEPQALSLLARAAQGSMRDALSLTDQAIAQGGNQVIASVVTDMLGLMDKNQLLKVVHAVVNKSPSDVMNLVNDIAEQAPDYDNVHSELASILHQVALTQWVPEACKLETTSAKAIFQLAKTIPAEQVQLLYQIALQGRKDLPFAADGRSAFEMTLMRMMSFAPAPPPTGGEELIESGASENELPVSSHREVEGHHQRETGDPGNVGKQEQAPESDALATSTNIHQSETVNTSERELEQSTNTHLHANAREEQTSQIQQNVDDDASSLEEGHAEDHAEGHAQGHAEDHAEGHAESHTEGQAENHAEVYSEQLPEALPEAKQQLHETSEPASPTQPLQQYSTTQESELQNAQETNDTSTPDSSLPLASYSNDEPPLDAYMDDVPPSESDDFYPVSDNDFQNGSEHYPGAVEGEFAPQSENKAPSPEEQLSATADMLALRQKLKQRKAQDKENEKAQSAAGSEATMAEQRMSNTLRSRFEKSDSVAASSAKPISEPISALSNSAQALQEQPISEHFTQKRSNLEQGLTQEAGLPNSHVVAAPQQQDDDFLDAEFDNDMPFANEEPASTSRAQKQIASQDLPPWETLEPDSGAFQEPSREVGGFAEPEQSERNKAQQSEINQVQQSEINGAQQNEPNEAQEVTQNSSRPVLTASEYNGLSAYLEDGSKLVHASQIDQWSNLVEQMPIAGLLKQLFLHASFSRNGSQVSLEIDNSQSHLLNDSAKQQLLDALHHGLGENVTIDISLGEPEITPFSLQQNIQAMRQAHAHSVVQTDEKIQALLSTFDASVVTDSVKAR